MLLDDFFTNNNKQIDLFVGSISFEDRCVATGRKIIEKELEIDSIYFIDYVYLPPIESQRDSSRIIECRERRLQKQGQNSRTLRGILESRGAIFKELLIERPLEDAVEFVKKFADEEEKTLTHCSNIFLDISTFTKPLIFLIIKMLLKRFEKKRIFIANTLPSLYSQSSLSFDISGVEIMPTYGGVWDDRKRNLLIAILGFEGNKLLRILTKWNFDIVRPIVGFPAFYPGLQDRALVENANAFQGKSPEAISRLCYAPAGDPFETYRVLENIIEECNLDDFNVAIAPLGPKPMALAAVKLALKYNLRVVYAFPQEYSASYSKDIGESFLYEMEMV